MTLRQRTLIIIGSTLIALNAVLYAIASTLLLSSSQRAEEQDTRKQVSGVMSVLAQSVQQFNTNFSDWAVWDDAYTFVQDGNPEFIQSNLIDAQLATMQINLIVLIQPSGRIVFGTGFDLKTKQKTPIPSSIQQHLTPNDRLLQHSNPNSSLSGVLSLPDGPMMVISRPILTSEGKGPIRGTLIVGRYLDSAEVNRFEQLTRLPLSIQSLNQAQPPPSLQSWRDMPVSKEPAIAVHPLNETTIAGYALINDIYGQPAIVLQTESQRTIYQQGQATVRFLSGSILGIGVVFCVVTLLLLERLALSRLAKLSNEVSAIDRENLSSRVSAIGHDELSDLAARINTMLTDLENYEHQRQQAAIALRQSEAKFRNLFENSQVGIFRVRMEDGLILDANQQFIAMTGYDAADVIGQKHTVEFYVNLEDRTQVRDQLQQSGELRNFEAQFRRRNGSVFWGLFSARLDAEFGCIDGVVADISDRKRIEDELRGLFAAMPDAILIYNRDGRCLKLVSTNPDLLVKPSEEQVNRTVYDVHPPDLAQACHRCIQQVVDTQRTLNNFEYSVVIANQTLWFSASIAPLSEDTVMWIARDISDRKQAEEALRHSEATNRALINAIPDLLFRIHSDGTYLDVMNSSTFKVLNPRQLSVGSSVLDSLPMQLATQRLHYIQQALQTRQLQIYEQRLDIDGEPRDEEVRIVPSLENEVLVMVRDITDRKHAEEALRHSVEVAEAANRAKSVFLANMSHELRTPLNVILGFTQLLIRGGSLNPQQQEYLDTINRSGEHLLTLINDVLEMSKIEAGRVTLNPTNFDLYSLLNWLYQMFQMKAQSKGLHLILEQSPDLPQYIRTDESKLRQVLVNLVGNAIKFTHDGTVVLRVSQHDSRHANTSPHSAQLSANDAASLLTPDSVRLSADDEASLLTPQPVRLSAQNQASPSSLTLLFEIEDTGPGITPEDLQRLFQPFVQTETGHKSQEGTGLGLAISQKFIHLMGGEISVNSTFGSGSTFRFTIQTTVVAEGAQPKLVARRTVIGLAAGQPTYRILVVEDKPENRQILLKLLTSVGFAVREAINGVEAIALCESWQPHLIWMDIRMPVMNGYEATKRIKAASEHADRQPPVVIALTGSVFEEDRRVALSMGCCDFVRKPFQAEVIFEKMAEFLGVRYLYAEDEKGKGARELGSGGAAEIGDSSLMATSQSAASLHASDLAEMPPEWLSQLHQAASRVNAKQVMTLIEQIPASKSHLAEALTALVNNFCFEEIVDLTR